MRLQRVSTFDMCVTRYRCVVYVQIPSEKKRTVRSFACALQMFFSTFAFDKFAHCLWPLGTLKRSLFFCFKNLIFVTLLCSGSVFQFSNAFAAFSNCCIVAKLVVRRFFALSRWFWNISEKFCDALDMSFSLWKSHRDKFVDAFENTYFMSSNLWRSRAVRQKLSNKGDESVFLITYVINKCPMM